MLRVTLAFVLLGLLALPLFAEPVVYEVAGVEDAGKLPKGATHVRCAEGVTDDVLKALGGVGTLESLDLTMCRKISADGLAQLAGLKKLTVLSLDLCRQLDDAALGSVAALPKLEQLNLHQGISYTDAGIAKLAALTELRSINIGLCRKVTLAGLNTLLALPKLEALELRLNGWIDDAALKLIAETRPQLTKLNLRECRGYGLEGFKQVASLSKLKWLDIGGYREFGVEVLDELAKLSELEHLNLIQSYKLRDTDLPHLGECKKLRYLGLEGLIYLTGECFEEWRPPLLEAIELKVNALTPAGVQAIAKLKSVRRLHVWDMLDSLTDSEAMDDFARMEKLEFLSVSSGVLSDATVAAFASSSTLLELEISGSEALTDAGVASLARLKRASRIEILSCDGVTEAAVSKLREALPQCKVLTIAED